MSRRLDGHKSHLLPGAERTPDPKREAIDCRGGRTSAALPPAGYRVQQKSRAAFLTAPAAGLAVLQWTSIARAQEVSGNAADLPWITMGSAGFFATSLRALVILFVLAILIESALSVIFNWRLFLQVFNGRGVKTLVMIVVSALVVWTFNVDVVFAMMKEYGTIPADSADPTLSRWLTALILAGGSAGVYKILVALGYRDAKPEEAAKPKPTKDKAWISVRATRKQAVGPILVNIRQLGAVTPDRPPSLAGVITTGGFWRMVWSVFFLDRTRFPPAGGYEVLSGFEYHLDVLAKDSNGGVIPSSVDGTYSFAGGAIIDFDVVL